MHYKQIEVLQNDKKKWGKTFTIRIKEKKINSEMHIDLEKRYEKIF